MGLSCKAVHDGNFGQVCQQNKGPATVAGLLSVPAALPPIQQLKSPMLPAVWHRPAAGGVLPGEKQWFGWESDVVEPAATRSQAPVSDQTCPQQASQSYASKRAGTDQRNPIGDHAADFSFSHHLLASSPDCISDACQLP